LFLQYIDQHKTMLFSRRFCSKNLSSLVRTSICGNTLSYKSARRLYSTGNTKSLVLVEFLSNGQVAPSTLATITAAKQLKAPISALVLSTDSKEGREAVEKTEGLDSVIVLNNDAYANVDKHQFTVAEFLEPLLAELQQQKQFTHIWAAHTTFGKNLLPRLGGTLDLSPISDVISVESENQFVRPIYAGNALASIESSDQVKLITVRPTAFDRAKKGDKSANVETFEPKTKIDVDNIPKWISEEVSTSDRPELASASIVISGGRGLKSGDNFKLLYDLADTLKPKAAVGATRAAVDDGMVPNDMQVGQTGKVVAPELYIAVGISGAIQHLAGMKDSKTIVAINKDGEAPIFQIADYGLVGDLFQIVPELTDKIKNSQ
jgi:electron transfer flavoprotein alpha subunit